MDAKPLFLALAALGLATVPAEAQALSEPVAVRVWLDQGEEPVLDRGQRARIYYRASEDAFVAIFHLDTNGTIRLLHPRRPDQSHRVRGGRDYRLLLRERPYWRVEDDPGIGYFFAVASRGPLDFSRFHYSHYDGGWDLSFVGRRVFHDPYLAMDEFVEALIPDWAYVPYALDFTAYHVQRRWEYPRFLCYDCHGFRTWTAWNPYRVHCTSFRVIVHTDPYYYPAHRYRGRNVVFVRPPRPRTPRFEFKERTLGEPGDPIQRARSWATRQAPSSVGRADPNARRGDPAEAPRRGPAVAVPGRTAPSAHPERRSRPTEVLAPSRRPESTRGGEEVRGRSSGVSGSTAEGRRERPVFVPRARTGSERGTVGTREETRSGEVRREGAGSRRTPVVRSRPSREGGSATRSRSRTGEGGPPARSRSSREGGSSANRAPPSRGGGSTARSSRRSESRSSGSARKSRRSKKGGSEVRERRRESSSESEEGGATPLS